MGHYDEQREAHQAALEQTLNAWKGESIDSQEILSIFHDLKHNPSNGKAIVDEIVRFKNACFEWVNLGRNDMIANEMQTLIKNIRRFIAK